MPAVDRNDPKRAASSESRYSVMEFMQDFPDDATCLEWLWRTRYSEDGTHAYCDKCQQERAFARYSTSQRRQSWTCKSCGDHVHPTAGTIFHKSATSLHLWFYAMYLMTSTRCGISAKQLERELGVTYKTAWRMYNLIRGELMTQDETPLVGEVEADETYVGGRPRLKDIPHRKDGSVAKGKGPKFDKKQMVFGAVERGGQVRATVVPRDEVGGIPARVEEFILPESVLFTDEFAGYDKVGQKYAEHHRIKHAAKVYVSGDVHTQTIDGFWSLLKRGLSGTYHAVSAKHLQGYLNEYAWRYNHRDALSESGPAMFALLLHRAASTTV